MADQNSEEEQLRLRRFSKENRWYFKTIDEHLQPASRKLLEEYSHIPPSEVDCHIYKMRDILWSHAPFPCIGEFKFLTLNFPSHPLYPHILYLLRPSPTSPGPFLLDLGCCVAQDLRSLTHSTGIPSSHLYGTDVVPDYLTSSYALFNDAETFKGTLVQANIFSETLFEDSFKGWENKFKVIHAGLFLHLFKWEQQVVVCEKIVKMLSEEKGSIFVGEMVGVKGGGERGGGSGAAKFWPKGEERKQYLHDESTFQKLWDEAAEKTGTKGCWKVEGWLKLRVTDNNNPSSSCAYFVGEGIGWFTFSVERI